MAYRGNTSNVPCKYFQQGNCKWGNSCKYAHVYANSNNSKQDQGNSMTEEELYRSFINANSLPKIQKTILNDLNESEGFQSRPLSSAYSYGMPCGVNLINDRDISAEESRFKFHEARQKGTLDQYEAEVLARERDMQKCFTHIKSHPDWAARFLQRGTKEMRETGQTTMKNGFINFPIDLGGQATFGGTNSSTAFGANPFIQGQNAFGTTNTFGPSTTGAFGGASASGSGGAFGFGGTSTNTTSTFGGGTTNTTGQSGGVFGKPTFSGFANTAAPSPMTSGAISTFGGAGATQPASSSSVFGQPQFGAAASDGSKTAAFGKANFGGSTFGQNAFGSSAGFNNNQPGANSNLATASPFSSMQTSGKTSSPFGSLQNKPAATGSPFGSLQNNTTAATTGSNFGSMQNNQSSQPSPFAGLQKGNNPSTANLAASNGPFSQLDNNTLSPFSSLNGPNTAGSPGNALPSPNKTTGAFGTTFGTQAAVMGTNTSPFGQPNGNTTNVFGSGFNSNPTGLALPGAAASAHRFVQGIPTDDTKLSPGDLDQQTVQQFEATNFILGKVPDIPPPVALIS